MLRDILKQLFMLFLILYQNGKISGWSRLDEIIRDLRVHSHQLN